MGQITKMAEKLEKALKQAGKKTEKVREGAAIFAAAAVAEAPGLALQVKKAAGRIKERMAEASAPIDKAEKVQKSASKKSKK